jgi:hypothetical protein
MSETRSAGQRRARTRPTTSWAMRSHAILHRGRRSGPFVIERPEILAANAKDLKDFRRHAREPLFQGSDSQTNPSCAILWTASLNSLSMPDPVGQTLLETELRTRVLDAAGDVQTPIGVDPPRFSNRVLKACRDPLAALANPQRPCRILLKGGREALTPNASHRRH